MNGFLLIGMTAVVFAVVGLFLSRTRVSHADEYVVSKNALGSRTLSMTIFATGMGVWILFGPPEALLTGGIIALFAYALSSSLSLWMFAFLGTKIRAINSEGKSLTEFVLQRFGVPMYVLVLVVTFVYMMLVVTAELSGIGLAGSVVFNIPAWQTILIIGLATVSYTVLGGFRASVETDKLQTYAILPLFAIVVGASVYLAGNFNVAWQATNIPLIGWTGIEYGIALLIGVLSAEAFNQVWWQRVYSGKDDATVRRGFLIAGLVVFPVVFIAGLMGTYSGLVAGGSASSAIFNFLTTMPSWLAATALVLAVTLMMSTLDSFLNGMSSIFLLDIRRMMPTLSEKKIVYAAQALTLLFAALTMTLATQGFGVLYLFLVANLVCAGAVFPVFYAMFSKSVHPRVALIASILGIISGALLFPDPSFTRGSLVGAFLVALLLPILITFAHKGATAIFKSRS